MANGRAKKRDGGRRRVLVIGAGFSGAAVAAQLLRAGKRVTLIGREARFGPGLAYGAAAGAHVVNVPAGRMSALDDEPDHFVSWLEQHGGGDAQSFAPRALYGRYIEDVLRAAAPGLLFSRLTKVRGEVVTLRREGERFVATLASGRAIVADAAVLALGHPPTSTPAPFNEADLMSPWDVHAQQKLPHKGDVLLIGAGLTMVDVALALATPQRKGVIYALSRRGRLPQTRAPATAPALAAGEPPLELSAALHAFRARAREDWRLAFDSLRAATPDLWARLGLERQRRFLRHLRPWWDSHRHRAAPEIAARLSALIAEGRVRLLAGEITSATREGKVWRLQHRGRGGLARHRLEVATVINCAGADYNVARWESPLVRQLLEEGLARAPANGLGFEVDSANRLCDRAGAAQEGLFLLGPLALGSFWETIAVPELRARAAAVARALE